MTIYIASDHAGFAFKSEAVTRLLKSYKVHDMGPSSEARTDYPDFADKLIAAQKKDPHALGILICGSGQGMAMRANKYPHVRAALCWSEETAQLARAHNDANILCLGARLLPADLLFKIIEKFLSTPFEGDRHAARVKKISNPISQ